MTKKQTWTISADRRQLSKALLVDELRSLAESIEGLTLEMAGGFDEAPDAGTYRDFIKVAEVSADDVRILEAMLEELVIVFGFDVDVSKGEPKTPVAAAKPTVGE